MADESDSRTNSPNEEDGDTIVTVGQLRDAIELSESERFMNGPKSMVCTYPENYVPRQSIFCCMTCLEKTGQMAGICFACSENCHVGHDVRSLYTKRLFCCDCGNSKFKDNMCKLFENKIPRNRRNKYNHNFEGRYCTCDKPYPPPAEDPTYNMEMIQCTICEDWFHGEHIGVPDDKYQDLQQEMVCNLCSKQYPWLVVYKTALDKKNAEQPSLVEETTPTTSDENKKVAEAPQEPEKVDEKPKYEGCVLENPEFKTEPTDAGFVFQSIEWRKLLCKCEKCTRMYEDFEIEYLADETDSALRYVEANYDVMEENDDDIYSQIAKTTSSDVALAVKSGIIDLRNQFTQYFENTDPKKVVTKQDIDDFFEGFKPKRFKPDEDAL